MIGFYIRQNFLYFVLATSFLVVYLATLFSWRTQRKRFVEIYEYGIKYRGASIKWYELAAVTQGTDPNRNTVVITSSNAKSIEIPSTIKDLTSLAGIVAAKLPR